MRLTRRDAIAALGAAGVAVGGGAAYLATDDRPAEPAGPIDEDTLRSMIAAARVLYPTEVEDVDAFVRQYVRGRVAGDPDRAAGISGAVAYLDDYAEAWHDDRFAALDRATRSSMLDRMGADTAEPDPTGADVERVRYHVINELLFALYSSPMGAALVGLENPQGHPGGITSYQQGPDP
jgi:hypothetical protein